MNTEYYYEEDYPDCIGEAFEYGKQPGCLTCTYKGDCLKIIKDQENLTAWETKYDY